MPVEQLQRMIHTACKVARAYSANDQSDGKLLEQFMVRKDELAFAELVRRHGPMVLGVCRRVIGIHQDAEDAFQATFLVLVRKASALSGSDHLAAWLHGVAYRTALEARGRLARQQSREAPLTEYPVRNDDASMRNEIKTIIDREVSRLPDKYRLPVILCELEGRSRGEAAQVLQLTEGTLSSRLATARKTLARRLSKYGFSLPATGLAVFLEQNAVAGPLPERLIANAVASATSTLSGEALKTIPAAVLSLADAVVRTMAIANARFFGVLVVAGLIATTVFVGSRHGSDAVAALKPIEPDAVVVQSSPDITVDDLRIEQAAVLHNNKAGDEISDLRMRLKNLENNIGRIRQEMLKECAAEEKRADEAVRRANAELQDAFRRKDTEAQKKAVQAIAKAGNDKVQARNGRRDIEARIRMDDTQFELQVGFLMSGGAGNTIGKLMNGAKDRGGMIVERIVRDSPAANAGLQPLDILLEFDGRPVPSGLGDFRRMLAEIEPQTAVEVTLVRKGKKQTIQGLVMPGLKE
jgi:RNA polymerase sigma factor (sigma-70 family)